MKMIVGLLYDGILDVGGVESHLLSLIRNSNSNEVSFVVFSAVSERFAEKAAHLNCKIVPLDIVHPLNLLRPFKLANLFRREAVDLAHAHSPTAALWGRLAAWFARIPACVTVHLPVDQYHGDLKAFRARVGMRFYQWLDRFLNHRSAFTQRIIYVSRQVLNRDLEAAHVSENMALAIPNGVDLSRFQTLSHSAERSRLGISTRSKVITLMGRLEPQKNVNLLIEAVPKLSLADQMLEVWIMGDGSLRTKLERQASKLGVDDKVHFWGHQDNVAGFLVASDIFVLPSKHEGMPVAVLEALAAGLPCIVTPVGENTSLISDGIEGLIVPQDDAGSLAKAIQTLLDDPALYQKMASAAEQKAQRFDERSMVKQIEQVYNQCLMAD